MSRVVARCVLGVVLVLGSVTCVQTQPEQEEALASQQAALAGVWQTTGSMPAPRVFHSATVLGSGKVLVAGGWSRGYQSTAEVYDPATGTWASTGSMATERQAHVAALLPSGKVLVAGGESAGYVLTAEVYDPGTETWSPAGSLSLARGYGTATVLASGRILVAGGHNQGGAQPTVDVYDPVAETWTVGARLTTPRRSHTATRLGSGRVLVVGGWSGEAIPNAEVYDPATNTWSATGALGTARYDHTATLLPSGKVLVTGGRNGGGAVATAELYDPATGTWTATGTMGGARASHTATMVGQKVLVAGGDVSWGAGMTSAEVYDPATGAWTATGSMTGARTLHVAEYLSASRQVLVVGGHAGSPLATAELYDASGLLSCAADTDCVTGFYCEAQSCRELKANGAACGASNQCTSGYCAGSVCCTASACQAPTVASVHPGWVKAGTQVTVTGTVFVSGSVAKVGSTPCTSTAFVSATTLTCTVPTLTNGTYAVTVTNPAGQSATLANALRYDGTPPAGGGTLNDGIASNSLTASPALTWTAFSDSLSGIDRYEYAVGTTAGGTQTMGWTVFTPGAGPGTTLTGLSLASGTTYYPSIRAYDRAGNFSTITGNGWLVDTTAPSAPTAFNDGTVTNSGAASPTAIWTASTDTGSGIGSYALAVGMSPGGTDVLGWTQVGLVTSGSAPGLVLAPGVTYYTSVRAYDKAGNASAPVSGDGWTYALTGASTLVFLPMDHTGPVAGDQSSVEFINYASAGARFRPVNAPFISTVSPRFGAGNGNFKNGYLTTTNSAANVIGNSDFTIELWVRRTGDFDFFGSPVITGSGWDVSVGNSGYNNEANFAFYRTTSSGRRHWGGDVGWGILPAGVWNHLSVSRSGTTLYTHLNGVLKDSITIPADARLEGPAATTSTLTVGSFSGAYLDDVLVTVGGVTHTTANFTVARAGPTPYIYLPLDGADDTDAPSYDFRNAVPGGVALAAAGTPSSSSPSCVDCGNFNSGTLATTLSSANVIGTRDFTIELWVNPSTLGGTGSTVLWGGNPATGEVYWDISLGNTYYNNSADFAFYARQLDGRHWGGDIGWGVLPRNAWTHLSVSRRGTTLMTHKNGVLMQTLTILATDRMEGPKTSSVITVGYYPALLDDVMITLGAARHTTTGFPVVRAPNHPRLPAVPEAPHVFLPFDGANGSTAFPNLAASGTTFTPVGSPVLTTATSRFGGASGKFHQGSLTSAATAANVIGTRDFTIEMWVNFDGSGYGPWSTPVLSGSGWQVSVGNYQNDHTAYFIYANGKSIGWGIPPWNSWTHLAVSRFQDRLYTHRNGVLVSIADIPANTHIEAGALVSALRVGESPSYLDDVMITIGSAKYTAASFPIAQLPKPFMYFPMDGANLSTSFPNYGTGPAVTNVSSPTITTTGAVVGGAAANLTAGSLTTAASSAYRLGTQDFTIELWAKTGYIDFWSSPVVAGTGWEFSFGNRYDIGIAYFRYGNGTNAIGWAGIPLNTWVHLSVTRSGTRMYTHMNGVLMQTLDIPATDSMEGTSTTSTITIGTHPSYVDDLLVTIGRARHTQANFTVQP